MLAFAAERRAAAPLLAGARRGSAAIDRCLAPARRSAANPPHAEGCGRMMGADGRPIVS